MTLELLPLFIGTFGLSAGAFVALTAGTAALGAGASMYGANKQSKDNAAANATNDARLAKQDQSAWNAYLLSLGIKPNRATTGELPTTNEAVNRKLPAWASASFTKPGAQKTWRKKGSTAPVGTLARGTTNFQSAPASNPYVMAAGTSGAGNTRTEDFLIGNPAGIGGKDRSFMDPLGIS